MAIAHIPRATSTAMAPNTAITDTNALLIEALVVEGDRVGWEVTVLGECEV